MIRRAYVPALAAALAALVTISPASIVAQAALPSPEQFAGHPIGADNKLVRWDRIVEYMKLAAQASTRVRVRELGKSTNGQPFIAVEISAPETLNDIERYKQLERKRVGIFLGIGNRLAGQILVDQAIAHQTSG